MGMVSLWASPFGLVVWPAVTLLDSGIVDIIKRNCVALCDVQLQERMEERTSHHHCHSVNCHIMGIVLDEEDDLPACRICQTTQSEMPEKVLIRPCLCSGSQAFVHVDCLNQWRATSSEAFTKCSICQYQYQIKRSVWTSLLSHSFTVSALCSGAFLCTCLLIGLVFHFTTKKLAPHKSFIPEMISEWIMKEIIGWSEGEALDCLVPEVRQGVADLLRDTLSSLDYEEKGGYYSSPSFSPRFFLLCARDPCKLSSSGIMDAKSVGGQAHMGECADCKKLTLIHFTSSGVAPDSNSMAKSCSDDFSFNCTSSRVTYYFDIKIHVIVCKLDII
eukprot:scaffold99_cov160-Ochromonas_danica.AAC.2